MIKLLTAIAFVIVIATACSTQPPNRDAAQQPKRDTPIGTILRRHAALRSLEQCKENSLSDEKCHMSLERDQQHLENVNARIETLLEDPRTNMCDLVRFAGSCNNPIYTLGDLADCLQVTADRGEALNSGRFVLKLDSHNCPTDAK
jgi:hypothetical protein